MKKLKSLLKNQEKSTYIFIFSALIVFVFFGNFLRMDFATDTYHVSQSVNYINKAKSWCGYGRPILGLWWIIVSALKFSFYLKYLTSIIIAIIACTLSIVKLSKILNKDLDNKYFPLLISTIIIINPFTIEYFLFLEKGIMVLSILFAIMSSEQFIKFLELKKKKNVFIAFIFMLLSVFCYQGSIALVLGINCLYIIKNYKKFKDFLINNIVLVCIYGLTLIVDYLLVTNSSRTGGEIIIKESIIKAIKGLYSMIITYNIWPKYMLSILFFVISVLFIIILIKNKDNIRIKLFNIFSIIYIGLVLTIATILPVIAQSTSAIWFTPRSTFSFGAIFGILSLYLIFLNKKSKNINSFIAILIAIVLIIQFCKFNSIILDHYNLNYRDKVTAIEISNSILKYEEENNIEVTKIGFYVLGSGTYSDIFSSKNINESAYNTNWSDFNIINYYGNRNLERVSCDDQIIEMFNSDESEDIIFIDDTVYVKIYMDNTALY